MDSLEERYTKIALSYLKSIDESLKILAGRLSNDDYKVEKKEETYAETYFKKSK